MENAGRTGTRCTCALKSVCMLLMTSGLQKTSEARPSCPPFVVLDYHVFIEQRWAHTDIRAYCLFELEDLQQSQSCWFFTWFRGRARWIPGYYRALNVNGSARYGAWVPIQPSAHPINQFLLPSPCVSYETHCTHGEGSRLQGIG